MDKIKRVSLVMRVICSLAFIALPMFVVWFWLSGGHPFGIHVPVSIFPYEGPQLPPLSALPLHFKIFAFLINLIPITFYMIVVGYLQYLFSLYGRSQIFTIKNVICIRRIGWTLLIWQIVKPFYTLLLTFTITYASPAGLRFAYIGLNVTDVLIGCAAVIIILISWIMEEGHKLQEEQSYTI
jgi:hypothetical protein